MKIQSDNYPFFTSLINESTNVLILVQENPNVDVLGAGLFLERTLTSLGKNVQIVVKGTVPEIYSNQVTNLGKKIEAKKLVIAFNWRETAVEKVGYDMDDETFNLIITPRGGEINQENIKISYRGKDADLVITLGIASLNKLSEYERDYLNRRPVVNIDKESGNQFFGRLNFVDDNIDSICAQVAKIAEKSGFHPSEEAVEFLFEGMRAATENFTSVVDPSTFEAAAYCTKIKKGLPGAEKLIKYGEEPEVPREWLAPKVFRSNKQAS